MVNDHHYASSLPMMNHEASPEAAAAAAAGPQVVFDIDYGILAESPNATCSTSSTGVDNINQHSSCEDSMDFFTSGELPLSIVSNLIFLLAGTMYLVLALWEHYFPLEEESGTLSKRMDSELQVLAPMTYMTNSLIDMYLANRIRVRRKEQKKSALLQEEELVIGTRQTMSREISAITHVTTDTSKSSNWRKRVRKHAAHRRDFYAAMSFFLAATLGSIYTLVDVYPINNFETDDASWLDTMSIHFYMLSAILAILGSRLVLNDFSFLALDFSRADCLEDLGDLVFFLGSIMDVVLCDFPISNVVGWVNLEIVSCVLWVLDALFYLRSDLVSLRTYRDGQLHILLHNFDFDCAWLERGSEVV